MRDIRPHKLSVEEITEGILAQNKFILSRAITLVESKHPRDHELSARLLDSIISESGKSIRIGITGVPGVGKSTFIERFGKTLTGAGKKIAVLSVDPTSSLTKGSILGDKTRMTTLSVDPNAFIRPSPSGTSLGGVAHRTRETILLCEAAGYEVIIVETVGVGQSETAVKNMVDFFLLLMLAGGGDELQGIKRGIMEMADAILISKADGHNLQPARASRKAYQNAIHLFPPHPAGWTVPVTICSALKHTGIQEAWEMIETYHQLTSASGYFEQNRKDQNLKWMRELIVQRLEADFFSRLQTLNRLTELENKVKAGELSVRHAVDQLFKF